MADHFCSVHDTVFFKKGRMRGYAHPIKDEEGKDTGKWCNEGGEEKILPEHQDEIDEAVVGSKKKPSYAKPRAAYAPSPEKIESIEGQKSADITAQLWIAGKLKDNDPLILMLYQYLSGKIGRDLDVEVKDTTTEANSPDKKTLVADILKVMNDTGRSESIAKDEMQKKYKVKRPKDLSDIQRKDYIEFMRANPKKGG